VALHLPFPNVVADVRRIPIHPDHWNPLAWSRDMKRGKPFAATFGAERIVLARTESDHVFALEDRCAHRQVPLHAGVISGESIRCCYHGWTYDSNGRCTDIPHMTGERTPIAVRSYPCREHAGMIFIFPGVPSLTTQDALPALATSSDPRYKTWRFGRVVRCHYSFMHENLMDMHHQFLHRKQMGLK
jgi:renierapurpurin 18,18'-hydroxylase